MATKATHILQTRKLKNTNQVKTTQSEAGALNITPEAARIQRRV